jgi:hypothetical protein
LLHALHKINEKPFPNFLLKAANKKISKIL